MMFRLKGLNEFSNEDNKAIIDAINAANPDLLWIGMTAPIWWQEHGLEWLYRLIKEPKRMWRRYIIGNTLFLWNMVKE